MTAPESLANEPPLKGSKQTFAYLRVLRPKQWTKNFIVFAPLIFAAKARDIDLFGKASLCFVCYCLISSSVYIFNDICDREADKAHPTKCKRPIASGEISPPTAYFLSFILLVAGLLLSYYIRHSLILVL